MQHFKVNEKKKTETPKTKTHPAARTHTKIAKLNHEIVCIYKKGQRILARALILIKYSYAYALHTMNARIILFFILFKRRHLVARTQRTL